MKSTYAFLMILLVMLLVGCGGLALRPTDFAWPVESVLKVDSKGIAEDERYNFTFNAKPLLFEETGDSVNVSKHSLRMIRDMMGYYYVTAAGFQNVYVFGTSEGALTLQNKIHITDKGMDSPAFNQRSPHVQLINGKDKPRLLSRSGIQQEGGAK